MRLLEGLERSRYGVNTGIGDILYSLALLGRTSSARSPTGREISNRHLASCEANIPYLRNDLEGSGVTLCLAKRISGCSVVRIRIPGLIGECLSRRMQDEMPRDAKLPTV